MATRVFALASWTSHFASPSQGRRKRYGRYGFGRTTFSLGLPRLVTKMRFRLQWVTGQGPLAAAYAYGLFQPSLAVWFLFTHMSSLLIHMLRTYVHVFYEQTERWLNTSHCQVIFLHAACNSKKRLALSMCTVTWIKPPRFYRLMEYLGQSMTTVNY